MSERRRGPYIENLRGHDLEGRCRTISRYLLNDGELFRSLEELQAMANRNAGFYGRRAYRLGQEIEEFLLCLGMPSDRILDYHVIHTHPGHLRQHGFGPYARRHRLMVDCFITSKGNLSVRFRPSYFGPTGHWEDAEEWSTRWWELGRAEIMERPDDEILFLRDVEWLFEEPRYSQHRESPLFNASCRAVNLAFWLAVHRLRRRFEIQFNGYVTMLSDLPDGGRCLGVEIVDAREEYLAGINAAIEGFRESTGHDPSSFWCVYESIEGNREHDRASKILRGREGPSSKLTPGVTRYYHSLLQEAVDYGLWEPAHTERIKPQYATWSADFAAISRERLTTVLNQTPTRQPPRPSRLPQPPARPADIPGLTPPKAERTRPPDYSNIPRYQASLDELAPTGCETVEAVVQAVNSLASEKGEWPVSQADFPRTRREFDRLLKRLARLRSKSPQP